MNQLIIKSIIISLFCVGLRIVTSPGMILYFLRMPYDWLNSELQEMQERSKFINEGTNEHTTIIKYTRLFKIAIYILKPIIACSVCMGSVWSIVISSVYFKLDFTIFLTIFIVCGLNGIIYATFEKLSK